MKLEVLPDEGEDVVVDVGREPPVFFDEEDDGEDEEEDEEFFAGVEAEKSSRVPHVSVVLSSTSRADRDTDGLRELSPGSSMAVSSKGLMKSSIMPDPAKRTGAAQTVAAIVKRMYFIVLSPFGPAFPPDFVGKSRYRCYTINR